MAVDVYYSDNFVGMISPRLSFSRDLEDNNESITSKSIGNDYNCTMESTFDFAFEIDKSIAFASTSADELFSDGKIIPTDIKTEEPSIVSQQQQVVKPCLDFPSKIVSEERKKSLKEFLEDSEDEEEPNNGFVPKSFWKFRRSNSLNCDRNQRKGLIGSWKILSRSGSTGKFLEKIVEEEEEQKPTTYNFHQKLLSKFNRNNSLNNNHNNNNNNNSENVKCLNRSSSTKAALRRSHSTSDQYFSKSGSNSDPNRFRRSHSTGSALKKQQSQKQHHQNGYQKGKVKDNSIRGYYGNNQYSNSSNNNNNNNNSLKVNPMLNLPSPYISRVSVDLLGFGSLFCNGSSNKDRKKKK